ncbi:MAG: alpha/beta hydrolase [Bacteroidales bacterium]
MRNLFIILTMVAGCLQLNAQNGPRNNRADFPEAVPQNSAAQLVEQNDEVYKADYIPNVVYAHKDGQDLTLQVFVPKSNDRKLHLYPCIIFIKGSAWMKQNVYNNIPQVAQFARRGYVVAIVEYRPTPGAVFPAQREDALDAFYYMRAHAKEYSIDPKNMFVWGDSSGAHTALFTALRVGNDTVPDINGVIAYYPPTNLLVMKDDPTAATTGDANSPEGLLMGKVGVTENPQKAKEISPWFYINKETPLPPIFLAHGTKDHVVPFSQSDILANKLQENGKEYEFYALRNADHGSWEFWTENMFDKVEAFIKRNLK